MGKLQILGFLASLTCCSCGTTARAATVQVDWITRYCNETIQTADLSGQPRMLRNISNSLMTAAPAYLDDAVYLQRRQNFTDLCPELNGIGETSSEWLRHDRVTLSADAVVVAAVREDFYPGSQALLESLGWRPLGETITLGYVDGIGHLPLYAGLIRSGDAKLSGTQVNALRNGGNITTASHYFFFQDANAFAPEVLANLKLVSVPEPHSIALGLLACFGFLWFARHKLLATPASTSD